MSDSVRTEATSSRAWHALPAQRVAELFAVAVGEGLSEEQAARRLAEHGPNVLPQPPRRRRVLLLVDQVRNPLILLLVGAAVVAGLVGDLKDAGVILTVIVINSVLGFVQEARAENSLESLRRMLAPTCVVRRGDRLATVPSQDVVPGDVVVLEAGSQVPADGRLMVAEQLEVDESPLTGESVPSRKQVEQVEQPGGATTAVADRSSMAFMNTLVTRGRGELVVTATGARTEVGRLAELISRTPLGVTPLQRQLARLGTRLAIIGGVAVTLYLALGLVRGEVWHEVLLSAVALAVAAVPEGLPVVVTVTLAMGVHVMARQGALVKQLASVETLGATSVVCTDKTGTLTLNQMTVRRVWAGHREYAVSGEGYGLEGEVSRAEGPLADGPVTDAEAPTLRELARTVSLCNDSGLADDGSVVGDPMEAALLALARKLGIDPVLDGMPRVAEVPFDARHRFMATVHVEEDVAPDAPATVAVKGALEALLDRCTSLATPDGGVEVLDDEGRAAVQRAMTGLAAQGLRVIAVARRHVPRADLAERELGELVADLTLLGLVGLVDPPRAGVLEAVAACHQAGIDVKMITGDHASTAEAIARELGISGRTCTGAELDAAPDDDDSIVDAAVFARVGPEHKLRIVRALQRAGRVTAMTGDGVNDAPALRAADIGVAMGKAGTQVSRDAAAMVLTDDHFATIVKAVETGRAIYANIVSFLRFQLTTNAGAVATMLAASAAGLPAPLTAVQILWVNMIMDGPPAVALGMDPPEPGVMGRPPRPAREHLLPLSRLGVIALNGAVMAGGTLGVVGYGVHALPEDQAASLAFTTFVLFQVVSALTVRSSHLSVFHVRTLTNRALWIALGVVVALQIVVIAVPFAHGVFDTTALTAAQWALAAVTASSLLVVDELRKLLLRRRRG